MPHPNPILGALAVTLGCLAAVPTAIAADETPATPAPRRAAASPFGSIQALSDTVLASSRGGTDVFSDMKLRGVVAENQASNLLTGNNTISDGAFSGTTGFPMVIQNSGNNVLIQSATIVNLQVN